MLLDTSFLVALERETTNDEIGPARRFLPSLRARQLVISIVSVEELLEGAVDEAAALRSFQPFAVQGLHDWDIRRTMPSLTQWTGTGKVTRASSQL